MWRIFSTLPSNSDFQKSVSTIMYCTILYRPQWTYRLCFTVLLERYFYRYSQLEFYITDSIQWMIERFRLGLGRTESSTFSMLFFRKSGRSYCYSMWDAMDYWINFWLVISSALSWVPFFRRNTQNLGEFSQKVVMISSSNFLDYSLQRRFCIMLQTSLSLALSFQYPLSINPLYFSYTSLTMMLSGLSLAISILGMYSIVSVVPTCLIFPSSSKVLQINSKLLMLLTLVNLIAWFRQINTSSKFLRYMWISARRSHIQNWLYCTIEFATSSAGSQKDVLVKYLALQQSRQGSFGFKVSKLKTSSKLLDPFQNQRQNQASKMHILGDEAYYLLCLINSSMTSMECLTNFRSIIYLNTKLKP